MARYALFFTFTGEAIRAMVDKPSDRAEAAAEIARSAGGSLEAYYAMLGGQSDGFAIINAPDRDAAAAASLRISSSGAFSHVETHELLSADEFQTAMSSAGGLRYQPPGS